MKQLKKINNGLLMIAVIFIAACNDGKKPATTTTAPSQDQIAIPTNIAWDIVNEYPHDPNAFTEGLEYKDGYLYESTGQYGHSDIRKSELKTGKVVLISKMEPRYFGEGLTLLNGKLYQLTYREGKGFIYDASSLKQTGTFQFNAAEGWGMTNNGAHLIYDDGTNIFHFIDPVTFNEVKKLAVTDEHGPVKNINEPELIHGFIYANQWQTETIVKIDTATGRVVGRADLSGIRQRLGISPITGRGTGPDVMNGIAWDAANNHIYITGKNWPKLVEIKLDN